MNRPVKLKNRDALLLVMRGVWLEALRRKDLYVLLFLMMVFLLGVGVTRIVGVQDASTGTFLLNLGLTIGSICAHILTLLLAARQLPDEIDNRTLHPMLARPVTRAQVLLGKWLACTLAGVGMTLLLNGAAWLSVPHLEAYPMPTLFQHLLLQPVSLGLLAAFALGFSILLPRGAGLVILGVWFLAGSTLKSLLESQIPSRLQSIVQVALLYLPNFQQFNLITRFTDGVAPWPWTGWFVAFSAGGLFTLATLILSIWSFERRPL